MEPLSLRGIRAQLHLGKVDPRQVEMLCDRIEQLELRHAELLRIVRELQAENELLRAAQPPGGLSSRERGAE